MVTLMIHSVVLECCFCFLEHVHVSVLFQPHTGKDHRGHLFILEHTAQSCVQLALEYLQ